MGGLRVAQFAGVQLYLTSNVKHWIIYTFCPSPLVLPSFAILLLLQHKFSFYAFIISWYRQSSPRPIQVLRHFPWLSAAPETFLWEGQRHGIQLAALLGGEPWRHETWGPGPEPRSLTGRARHFGPSIEPTACESFLLYAISICNEDGLVDHSSQFHLCNRCWRYFPHHDGKHSAL